MTAKAVDAKKYDKFMKNAGQEKKSLKWYSPENPPFVLAGFPWFENDRVYRRLPLKPEYPLPEAVDRLADSTAGGQIKFRTNSAALSIRVRLSGPADLCNIPAIGQCGFDCYIGEPGRQVYIGTTIYDRKLTEYEYSFFNFDDSKLRNITLNFPLYQGVEEISLGLAPGASVLQPAPFASKRPVVVYGTSATQGGCASRPGMAYTNILSRYFNREFINLGFSGNGKGEPEVARIISGIKNPACFVIDYEGNCMGVEAFKKSFPEFIRILRESHPGIPILAVSMFFWTKFLFDKKHNRAVKIRRLFQKKVVSDLRKKGDRLVFFKDGYELLGTDCGECTVDGVHPSDLGFRKMADGLKPVFRKILIS